MRLPNGYGGITKISGKRRKPWRVRVTVGWDQSRDKLNPTQKHKTLGYFSTLKRQGGILMRLPNGYGGITKISGKRRKPWRVRLTVGWDQSRDKLNPTQKYKTLGYFATRAEAMNALALYHNDPTLFSPKPTLEQVYNVWSPTKFKSVKSQSIRSYNAAFLMASPLHNKPISDITLSDAQTIIDNSPNKFQSKSNFKSLMSQLFDYAIANKIMPPGSNYMSHLNIGDIHKSNCHTSFTAEELAVMWQNADDLYIRIALMMIYSGCRPGELLAVEKANVDIDKQYYRIVSGKTKNAARNVPIADRTLPFFKELMDSNKKSDRLLSVKNKPLSLSLFKSRLQAALDRLDILYYNSDSGERKPHLPDDTRHTFTSMWTNKQLNETFRRFIQGHSRNGVGEQVYTHLSIETLVDAVNQL